MPARWSPCSRPRLGQSDRRFLPAHDRAAALEQPLDDGSPSIGSTTMKPSKCSVMAERAERRGHERDQQIGPGPLDSAERDVHVVAGAQRVVGQ